MIEALLLALAPVAAKPATSRPCLPAPSSSSKATTSAITDHRMLRHAIGEPMPQSSTMVMLFGRGGHLSTEEYSIVLVKAASGLWQGTAVGRSRILVEGSPYSPMKRAEWVLDQTAGRRLDDAISRRCGAKRVDADKPVDRGPPPLGLVPERIDVLMPGRVPSTFYVDEEDEALAALIRPPR